MSYTPINQPATPRFIVAPISEPSAKRAGLAFEVIDRQHPSDGGPVAVAAMWEEIEAQKIAACLNAILVEGAR